MATRRRNVTTACDACKRRRIRCPGERPECERCQSLSKSCVYTDVDGRLQRAAAREELSRLRDHFRQCQTPSGLQTDGTVREGEVDQAQSALRPFGTGGMVLDLDGRLHLTSDSTFYRSTEEGSPRDVQQLGMDVSIGTGMASTAPPEDRYQLESQQLIGLALRHTVSFGMVDFSNEFWQDRANDPTSRTPWYSRFLYLVLLAIGWRHQMDPALVRQRYDRFEDRGMDLIRIARRMVDEEAEHPKVSTILGLYLLCTCLVGMGQDRIASVYYSIGMDTAQEFNVHLRCDDQLARLGMDVGCSLDRARRSANAATTITTAWWSSYFARASVTGWQARSQRPPVVASARSGVMYPYHVELAELAIEILDCNHSALVNDKERMMRAKQVQDDMRAWSLSLPDNLRWPTVCDTEHVSPSIVATLALHEAYHILLCRPYMSASRVDLLKSLETCSHAAANIMQQTRYLADRFGAWSFPVTVQHILFVAGTVIIVRLSGIAPLGPGEAQGLRRDLDYILKVMEDMSRVWPAASRSRSSLRQLEQEYCFDG